MDNSRVMRRNYRNQVDRRRESRQRRSQKIQRKYLYGRGPAALVMVAVASVSLVLLAYAASMGLTITADVFSFVGQALTS